MRQPDLLKRPDIFENNRLIPQSLRVKKLLLQRAQEAENDIRYQPNMGVIIRTKNDKAGLDRLLRHINAERRFYKGRIDVVVVDTESTDGTQALAKDFGAQVVTILQKDFTYPLSINIGLESLKSDVVAAFITVGHAEPALGNCLQAGIRHFKDSKVVGVYAQSIPSENASWLERGIFWNSKRLNVPAHVMTKFHMGVMGATGCMVRVSTWKKHKFSKDYAHGGEDTAWARWAVDHNLKIVFEPALSVHHSHSLDPINMLKQHIHWTQVYSGPGEFDQNSIRRRRPDLFKN